jgi:hypothetical protein
MDIKSILNPAITLPPKWVSDIVIARGNAAQRKRQSRRRKEKLSPILERPRLPQCRQNLSDGVTGPPKLPPIKILPPLEHVVGPIAPKAELNRLGYGSQLRTPPYAGALPEFAAHGSSELAGQRGVGES